MLKWAEDYQIENLLNYSVIKSCIFEILCDIAKLRRLNMSNFDAIVENNNEISAWIKWIHYGVPDEEGKEREDIRNRLADLFHCKKCTALSGCYFVTNEMPGHLPPEMLHPRCDCTYEFVAASQVKEQARAICSVNKFSGFVFQQSGIRAGKDTPYLDLGFDINDSEYLSKEYERQAKERYEQGQYVLHKKQTEKSKTFGQTINIVIELTGNGKTRKVRSGWMVHPLGLIVLATPYLGYVG